MMTSGDNGIEFDLLSSHESMLEVQSTDVYRTLQSGYSELHGIFAAWKKDAGKDNEPSLTEKQYDNLVKGHGMPAFKVRHAKEINQSLKRKAITDGYIMFPIYSFIENGETEWTDDLPQSSCPFVVQTNHKRNKNDYGYQDLQYLKKKIAPAFYADFGE